jgi:hypothetical protein
MAKADFGEVGFRVRVLRVSYPRWRADGLQASLWS